MPIEISHPREDPAPVWPLPGSGQRPPRVSRRKRLLAVLAVIVLLLWLFDGQPFWSYSLDIERVSTTPAERDALKLAESLDLPALLNTPRYVNPREDRWTNETPDDPLGRTEPYLIDGQTVRHCEDRLHAFALRLKRVDISVRYEARCERREGINITQLLSVGDPVYVLTGDRSAVLGGERVRTFANVVGIPSVGGAQVLDEGFLVVQKLHLGERYGPLSARYIDLHQVIMLDDGLRPVFIWAPFPDIVVA